MSILIKITALLFSIGIMIYIYNEVKNYIYISKKEYQYLENISISKKDIINLFCDKIEIEENTFTYDEYEKLTYTDCKGSYDRNFFSKKYFVETKNNRKFNIINVDFFYKKIKKGFYISLGLDPLIMTTLEDEFIVLELSKNYDVEIYIRRYVYDEGKAEFIKELYIDTDTDLEEFFEIYTTNENKCMNFLTDAFIKKMIEIEQLGIYDLNIIGDKLYFRIDNYAFLHSEAIAERIVLDSKDRKIFKGNFLEKSKEESKYWYDNYAKIFKILSKLEELNL